MLGAAGVLNAVYFLFLLVTKIRSGNLAIYLILGAAGVGSIACFALAWQVGRGKTAHRPERLEVFDGPSGS